MPTHMSLNETQQYGECHGLFRTSAEHLQADQAVPKKPECFTEEVDSLNWSLLVLPNPPFEMLVLTKVIFKTLRMDCPVVEVS